MKIKLTLLALAYLAVSTLDYQDQVAYYDQYGIDSTAYDYAAYYVQDECFTDSCVGCVDDCLDTEED